MHDLQLVLEELESSDHTVRNPCEHRFRDTAVLELFQTSWILLIQVRSIRHHPSSISET